jgi:hypothetical protein
MQRNNQILKRTVEPVLGTQINIMNMKRFNSRCHLKHQKNNGALCYNLKNT